VTRLALAITNKKKTGILWEIGVTDNKRLGVGNESGARLYMVRHGCKAGNQEKALCAVCSLLPESDFDSDCKLMIQLKGEGRKAYGGQWFQGTGQEW
jgi:hypothetical protein